MQQAARVSDRTAFFNLAGVGQPGRLVEYDDTAKIFSNPVGEVHRGLHFRPLRLTAPRGPIFPGGWLACCSRPVHLPFASTRDAEPEGRRGEPADEPKEHCAVLTRGL